MKYLRTGEERLMRIAYLNRMTVEEKTHSPDIGMRYFIFYFSVLPYILWILRNLMRSLFGTDMDHIHGFHNRHKNEEIGSITGDFG